MRRRVIKNPTSRPSSSARYVVGHHACREVLRVRPNAVREVLLEKNQDLKGDLAELMNKVENLGLELRRVPRSDLEKIARSHQGLALLVDEQPEIDWKSLKGLSTATIVALDEISDPHNLGAVMRTAWLMGVEGVFVTEHRGVGLSPAVSKVASGATEHLPLEVVKNLTHTLSDLKDAGFWIFGLAHRESVGLWSLQLPEKVVWVIGSEERGLRKSVASACDQVVSIYQKDSGASYNASVAAAMALAETCRQRQNP